MREQAESTARQERAIKHFLRDFLDKPRDGQSFAPILERVGRYYDADRVCIFELNAERTRVCSTHAWCREGIPEMSDSLQEIDPGGVSGLGAGARRGRRALPLRAIGAAGPRNGPLPPGARP